MATSIEERPTRREDQAPDWSPLPQPLERGPSPRTLILRRLAGAALIVALLLVLGHRTAALILLALMAALNAAAAVFPAVGRGVGRVEAVIRNVAGRGLGILLMGIVHLLVFTPVWLLLRLVRYDPLDRGQKASDASFWRPVPTRKGRPLDRRQFAYEREPRGTGATRSLRLRAALGVVLAIVLVDLAVGAVIDRLSDDATGSSLFTVEHTAAGNDPRSVEIGREVVAAAQDAPFDPFLGWRVADYHGRYVNVDNGVRRSAQAPGADAPGALEIYFFGGSAMFGAFQSDEHTIPSEFARLAAADGIDVRVVNYGQTAYVTRQEVQLLESLLVDGRQPDLAVFYDGFNELMSQFALGPHRQPTTLEARAIQERLDRGAVEPDPSLYRAWSDASALHRLGRSLGLLPEQDESGQPLRSPWNGVQLDGAEQRARNAVRLHAQQVDLASRLAQSYDFQTAFFWQPSIYTKEVAPGEKPLLSTQSADPEAWRIATRIVRSNIEPPVVDLGDALDDLTEPVMYDFVHTNEAGAAAIAAELYDRLRPQLQLLAAARNR